MVTRQDKLLLEVIINMDINLYMSTNWIFALYEYFGIYIINDVTLEGVLGVLDLICHS